MTLSEYTLDKALQLASRNECTLIVNLLAGDTAYCVDFSQTPFAQEVYFLMGGSYRVPTPFSPTTDPEFVRSALQDLHSNYKVVLGEIIK